MEIWQVREEKLEIVPYFSLRQNIITENTGLKYGIHAPFFLYDSGFGSESKLLDILKAFELYKEASGKNMLILHGSPLLELSHIIQIIRTFDLHDSVKLVSLLEP